MPRITPSIEPVSPFDHVAKLAIAAAVIAALYFGSEILIPLALAILLSFALAPAVKVLQKLGLGRGLPVAITVLLAFLFIAGLASLVIVQLRDLSTNLARFEGTMVQKIETLKRFTSTGTVAKVEEAITKVTQAVGRATPPETAEPVKPADSDGALTSEQAPEPRKPVPVEVVRPPMRPLDAVMLVASPLLHPLSTAFIVLIFVIFILLQREDLRNRAIRLFGASDLQRATAAIDDGGKRLSRYLLTQLAVNAGAGLLVGTALWLLGVPSPILLGILFACARFVPYVGPVIGSALPLLLATAVDPGWSMVLWTAALLVIVELVIGQAIEPVAYGHNTGLSPIAIVMAATFWTVLWGPVGLLLSTPLTVCLVVLGRHVEALEFLDVLLGDRPPLSASETFYQRLLANDPIEVADQAHKCLSDMSLMRYVDEVALPGLLMAQDDAAQGRLDLPRQAAVKASAMEALEDLDAETPEDDKDASSPSPGTRAASSKDPAIDDLMPEQVPAHLTVPGSVLCIGARGPLDDAAAALLAQVFLSQGVGAVAESYIRLSKKEIAALDVSAVKLIFLSALDGTSPAFLRFALRRLRHRAPGIEILVGTWWRRNGLSEVDKEIDDAIRQDKVATVADAVRSCYARGTPQEEEAAVADRPGQRVALPATT